MQLDEISVRLDASPVAQVTADELAALLAATDLQREDNTVISGMIRVLRLGDEVLIQERTPQGDFLIRRAASADQADAFVQDRLETYDRMWDGCGCKVRYYDP